MSEIRTFTQFVKRLAIVISGLILIVGAILGVLIYTVPPVNRFAGLLLPTLSNPAAMMSLLNSLGVGPSSLFFRISVFPGFTWAALIAAFAIWFERKYLAKMQVRVGPLYAGKIGGILQPIADLFKLLFKEMMAPAKADKFFFYSVPIAVNAVSAALLAVIPVSEEWVIMKSDFGLLVIFAVTGFSPILVLLAGWASVSKYPFIGALRGLHQMVSYEIPMLVSALGVVLLAGTLDLVKIVQAQSFLWFILLQPIGAVVFLCCLLAELERIPFDLPVAEPEVVMGYLTEYSGMAFGSIQLGVYVRFYALSAVFTTLFLGGWVGPQILPPGLEQVSQVAWFALKTFAVMVVMMTFRGVNPRVRIDLLLRIGWARLLILAFINLFLVALILQVGLVG